MSQEATAAKVTKPWAGLGYEQVPGLANRYIARYLRERRKFMRRFFLERGFIDLVDRMDQIRKSRQGMLAKNRMFQKVLDDYARIVSPPTVGAATPAVSEATSAEVERSVEVQPAQDANHEHGGGTTTGVGGGAGGDPGVSVPEVASPDSNGMLIEE